MYLPTPPSWLEDPLSDSFAIKFRKRRKKRKKEEEAGGGRRGRGGKNREKVR